MSRLFRKIVLPLLALLCFALPSCTDDDAFSASSRCGVVKLVLPGVLGSGTRTVSGDDAAGHSATYIPVNGENAEGKINPDKGLWFFAFPQEDGSKAVSFDILDKLSTATVDEYNHKTCQIEMPFGKYHFYLAGNIEGLREITTEDGLKKKVLTYTENLTSELTPGNLPMYRSAVEADITAGRQDEVDMHMVFLCSKVSIEVESAIGDVEKMELEHVAAASVADETACKNYSDFSYIGAADSRISVYTSSSSEAASTPSATFYLPEYYVAAGTKTPAMLYITIGDKEYGLPLGGEAYESTPIASVTGGDLERGVHYDIKATASKEQWNMALSLFQWNTVTLDAAFTKTTLRVAKTGGYNADGTLVAESDTILATSLLPALLPYESNAATLQFECADKIDEKPIIVAEQKEGNLVFSVNPDLTIQDFDGKTEGVAKVTVTANNLKKELWISYNVTPFLTVSPTSIVFESDATEPVTVNYSTNLPYVSLVDTEGMNVQLNEDGKTITVTPHSDKTGKTFNVVAGTAERTAGAATLGDDITLSQAVNVTYKRNNIRVNFIAINDGLNVEAADAIIPEPLYQGDNSTKVDYDYENSLPQTYNVNGTHSFGTPKLNNSNMTQVNNTGWYYTENVDATALRFTSSSSTFTYKLPGSGKEKEDTPYQYPYKDGTLPMFNFDTMEGWLVWDPTVESCEFLDFQPTIADVKYDIYVYSETPVQGVRWYRRYGWINNNVGRFLIQSEKDTDGAYKTNEYPVYNVGNNWYKTTITLKATRHDKHKNIKLLFRTANGTIDTGMIYAGEDYSVATGEDRCEGYFDANGKWNKGVPTDAATSGEQTNVSVVGLEEFGDEVGGSKGSTNGEWDPYDWETERSNFSTQGNNGFIRVYFYNPQEPSSWTDEILNDQVYLHLGFVWGWNGGGLVGNIFGNWPADGPRANDYLEPVVVDGKRVPHWYYYEITNKGFHNKNNWTDAPGYYGRWKCYRNVNNQILYLAFRTGLYDLEHDNDGKTTDISNPAYKSDLWAWANMYNDYFPDIRISFTGDRMKDRYEPNAYNGGDWPNIGTVQNAVALYCMDGKCYINQRPR